MSPHPLAHLRSFPPSFPSLACDSATLVETDVPITCTEPRAHWLSWASTSTSPPPVVACSHFIPDNLVEHLMRNKRDSAITTKYLAGTAITNGEAALHSFVTALVPAAACGDYAWHGRHSVVELGPTRDGRRRRARRIVLSTALHQDFEDGQVAETLFAVAHVPISGQDLYVDGSFSIPTVAEKEDELQRAAYDFRLKRHAVRHLVSSGSLPSLGALPHPPWSSAQATTLLKRLLSTSPSVPPSAALKDRCLVLESGTVLSLDMLVGAYIASLSNELSALEALCALDEGGYAYTFSPPAIFARRLPADLSTLLVLCALREIVLAASSGPQPRAALPAMRLFALGTHLPALAALLPLARAVLPPHVVVLSRDELFPASHGGALALPPECDGATLVVHNNSDAFGQNIESEAAGGSLDGVLGVWTDASRSLRRDREDLLDFVG
ncbi:hypothetical protein JCM9279_007379 [Rhodotorula babjevae]